MCLTLKRYELNSPPITTLVPIIVFSLFISKIKEKWNSPYDNAENKIVKNLYRDSMQNQSK